MKLHFIHDWGKWEVLGKGDLYDLRLNDDDIIVGSYTEQRKMCLTCGIVKDRIERNR